MLDHGKEEWFPLAMSQVCVISYLHFAWAGVSELNNDADFCIVLVGRQH
jgi:hypothetical protein